MANICSIWLKMAFDRPHIIQIPKLSDPRGNLSFLESENHVPFIIRRAYWIYDVPGGMYRDGHAFRQQQEVIIALSGSFDVVLNDGTNEVRHHMARSYYALYVPPMTWRKIDNFSTNSVVLVLSSELYDPNDYIENFDEYLQLLKSHQLPTESSNRPHPDRYSVTTNLTSTVDDCKIIELDRHHHANGNLTVVQDDTPIPFEINRAYYIYDIPGGESRGGHAHRSLQQLIIAISGSFDVLLDDGKKQRKVTLNRPYQGLTIVPGIWRVLDNFSSGSVCLCIASQHYDESDYIREHSDFMDFRNNLTTHPNE